MLDTLAGIAVAVVGGDLRQLAVAGAIVRSAGQVRTFGLPDIPGQSKAWAADTLCDALKGAAAVIVHRQDRQERPQ